jgi:hypothetical protein
MKSAGRASDFRSPILVLFLKIPCSRAKKVFGIFREGARGRTTAIPKEPAKTSVGFKDSFGILITCLLKMFVQVLAWSGVVPVMDADAFHIHLDQPNLFQLDDTSTNAVELFPEVWSAGEAIISPDHQVRRHGLEQIAQSQAARFSPLIAYLLVTRLMEPEIDLRSSVVNILADALRLDSQGRVAPELVRLQLFNDLARMRTRQIFALLQVADFDPQAGESVAVLLNSCSFAGNHLADILMDRKIVISIRMRAVELIGKVGYLDAIPVLERIRTRLESRLNGQQHMPFLTLEEGDEVALLPAIQATLEILRSV